LVSATNSKKEKYMKLNSYLRKIVSTALLAAFSLVCIQMPAMADIVSTDQIAAEQRNQVQRDAVRGFLDRADVQAQLEARGVDAADALKRVDSLTATELASLSEQIDTLPAGEGALGFVIGLIVIFMLLDIAGVTDVFPAI
tara:strand:+ start:2374 stop:2796 length:423 start_codon:yes stop_codon:yes gene_type:complete